MIRLSVAFPSAFPYTLAGCGGVDRIGEEDSDDGSGKRGCNGRDSERRLHFLQRRLRR